MRKGDEQGELIFIYDWEDITNFCVQTLAFISWCLSRTNQEDCGKAMRGSVLLPFCSSFHLYDAMINLSIAEKQYNTGEELEKKVRIYQETNMERL